MRKPTLFIVAAGALFAAEPALTIYNQNFAVIRNTVRLELQKGDNHVTFGDITTQLEPESVILRDVTGRVPLRILEQNFRADPVSAEMLLSLFEGKIIEFLVHRGDKDEIVPGKIIRSGYVATSFSNLYNRAPQQTPVIEINGKLHFALPGQPLFPALAAGTVLKPVLDWTIGSDREAKLDAELAYVSKGITWSADYNVVASEGKTGADVIGWVGMQNNSGKTFENAHLKLMAGDVSKLQPPLANKVSFARYSNEQQVSQAVAEKAFDEYHLYTLARPATLHDKETKQVEFIRAGGVALQQIYVYDGVKLDQFQNWNENMIRNNAEYGSLSSSKVWVMQEFRNSLANHLGVPLPAGRVRF